MYKSRTQQLLLTNWVPIVLAVVILIQGFALNELVAHSRPIYQNYSSSIDHFNFMVHVILCFILVLRFVQTYMTAAIDYNPWTPGLFDILIIFTVGALEYFIFSSLVPNFDVVRFHRRLSIIAFVTIIGYLGALYRLEEDLFPEYGDYLREVRLQVINVVGVVVGLITSILIITNPTMASRTQMLLALVAAGALAFNIFYSLRITFSARGQVLPPHHIEALPVLTDHARSHQLEVTIQKPKRKDVEELCQMMVQHFGYYYSALFDASVRLTQHIFKDILLVNGGKHPLGYKSFYIARDRITSEIVGCLLFQTRESYSMLNSITGVVGSALIVLKYLGVVGFFRTARNLRIFGTEIPALEPDELQIMYLAVHPVARYKHVGSQLVKFIRSVPESQNKNVLMLEVREANKTARQFFKALGFNEEGLKSSIGDRTLGRGAKVLMSYRQR